MWIDHLRVLSPPENPGDSGDGKNLVQKLFQVTNFLFVVSIQLNFPLYAKNYIAICHRTLQGFIQEKGFV